MTAKRNLIEQAEEELWAKIMDMAETGSLSQKDWLEIIDDMRLRAMLSLGSSAPASDPC